MHDVDIFEAFLSLSLSIDHYFVYLFIYNNIHIDLVMMCLARLTLIDYLSEIRIYCCYYDDKTSIREMSYNYVYYVGVW